MRKERVRVRFDCMMVDQKCLLRIVYPNGSGDDIRPSYSLRDSFFWKVGI